MSCGARLVAPVNFFPSRWGFTANIPHQTARRLTGEVLCDYGYCSRFAWLCRILARSLEFASSTRTIGTGAHARATPNSSITSIHGDLERYCTARPTVMEIWPGSGPRGRFSERSPDAVECHGTI